ncbi:MAG: hypothetical protein GY756_16770 [bacterium]|nr:hypothetical protein [bacterium]
MDESKFKKLISKLEGSYDLNTLPEWGPYTKKYIGTSHISDKERGLRFDLSVFPGYYRRRVDIPNVFYETEYYPWEASTDGKYFKFRHMLEWKDRVYTDISYYLIDETTQGVKVNFVNNTDLPESLVLHLMGSMHFPSIKEYEPNNLLYPAEVKLFGDSIWCDSTSYKDLKFYTPKPTDNLVADGKLRGELRTQNFVKGAGIELGEEAGDKITFEMDSNENLSDVAILLRYKSDNSANFKLTIRNIDITPNTISKDILLQNSKIPVTELIKLGKLARGKYLFELTSTENSKINLDGFVMGELYETEKTEFFKTDCNPVPQIINSHENSLILKYKNSDEYYGIVWDYPVEDSDLREFFCRDLDIYFKIMANEHVLKKFHGEGNGHFSNVFLRPITLEKNSEKDIYCAVTASGNLKEVIEKIKVLKTENYIEHKIKKTENNLIKDNNKYLLPGADKYEFSQEILKTVLLTNIVYPVYNQGNYIRHSTPGKWWDCLYTWDSGFIGLGLLEYDLNRAIENLNAYLTKPGSQSAFVHHGSPVPVQHYLFFEIWNRTQSKELLEYFYPRLKQYYMFLSGNSKSSTTRKYDSNLLQTWDYFYNSGGWDDYPPQYFMHQKKLENITPVITTAHCIRIAKFLKMYSDILDLKNDSDFYKNDIIVLNEALQKYSWDEDSGYFSYVCHDKKGLPASILKHSSGENFNQGLDGAYPVVSGICTTSQEIGLTEKIKSPENIWSNAGLSAVDQSSPYYKKDGYWNGTVWMSHQWFFWKTLFDIGEYEFAEKVAHRALDIWKQETDSSYRSLEHFLIETKRGAGWHAFGGLSSPILNWFNAYYKIGTVNNGFDTIILSKTFPEDFSSMNLKIRIYPRENKSGVASILVVLKPDYTYSLKLDNSDIELININPGNVILNINRSNYINELMINIK